MTTRPPQARAADRGRPPADPTAVVAALDEAMDGLFRLRGVLDPTQVATGLGMSVSEALALRALAGGERSQQEMAAGLGLEKSTVSRLVDAMVAKGWVSRTAPADDRRLRSVRLTRAGTAAAHAVTEAMQRRHHNVLTALTPDERKALAVGLPALVRALAQEPEHPAP